MNELQLLVSHAVKLVLLLLIAGLVVRARARECWSFVAYVVAVFVGNSLASLWPQTFFNPSFWVLKQGVYDGLKMAVALELAFRAFDIFPGAKKTVRQTFLVLLVISAGALGALTPESSYMTLWEWQPGTAVASLWLLTATALLVVFYQVPVRDWQRAILLGFAPYLLVFVAVLELLKARGWAAVRNEAGLLDSVAYLALTVFWTWAVWRRSDSVPTEGRP
jgi:uncharacterized membrane protein